MESKFTGSVLGFIGYGILFTIVTPITLGLAIPWLIVSFYGWIYKNTYIDGKQLKFVGSGIGLFGHFIKWWILSIVTLGIYSLWIPKKTTQWVVENTHFMN